MTQLMLNNTLNCTIIEALSYLGTCLSSTLQQFDYLHLELYDY